MLCQAMVLHFHGYFRDSQNFPPRVSPILHSFRKFWRLEVLRDNPVEVQFSQEVQHFCRRLFRFQSSFSAFYLVVLQHCSARTRFLLLCIPIHIHKVISYTCYSHGNCTVVGQPSCISSVGPWIMGVTLNSCHPQGDKLVRSICFLTVEHSYTPVHSRIQDIRYQNLILESTQQVVQYYNTTEDDW